MNYLEQSLALHTEEDVLKAEDFLVKYRAFCLRYGFDEHVQHTLPAMIEDTLILSAVKLMGAPSCSASTTTAYANWPERAIAARVLYKQAYHIGRWLTRMDTDSLNDGMLHFFTRAQLLAVHDARSMVNA